MSLLSALQSDANSKINWYVERRKTEKSEWETIVVVESRCNNGVWGVLEEMKRQCMTSELGKYNRAKKKGSNLARIVTWNEKNNWKKSEL